MIGGSVMEYLIQIMWDPEAEVWIATSNDVPGLVLECGSYDALIERLKTAVPELIELNKLPICTGMRYVSDRYQPVSA